MYFEIVFLFRKMTNMRKIDAKKGLHRVLTYGLYQGRMPSYIQRTFNI